MKKNNSQYRSTEVLMGIHHDGCYNMKILLKRCKATPSEFSKRLEAILKKKLEPWEKAVEATEKRHKLKAQLGITGLPLVLLWRIYRYIKENILSKGQKDENNENLIMTDINVPTDFANLCINRK